MKYNGCTVCFLFIMKNELIRVFFSWIRLHYLFLYFLIFFFEVFDSFCFWGSTHRSHLFVNLDFTVLDSLKRISSEDWFVHELYYSACAVCFWLTKKDWLIRVNCSWIRLHWFHCMFLIIKKSQLYVNHTTTILCYSAFYLITFNTDS